jgi:hypothetical protein
MWQDMLACMIPPGLNNSPRKRLKSHPRISAVVFQQTLCRPERRKAPRYKPVSSIISVNEKKSFRAFTPIGITYESSYRRSMSRGQEE